MYHFVNPYNFIPFSGSREEAGTRNGTYTGVIEYRVLTKTPLFIPNTSNDNAFAVNIKDHKSYDFFSYTDLSERENCTNTPELPVIPGSEMRGMLRSNFEILTNSCLSSIDDDVILSRRTTEIYKPGLICKNAQGKYDLYLASCKSVDRVEVAERKEGEYLDEPSGYLLKGEKGPTKNMKKAHCFSRKGNRPIKRNISLDNLNRVLKQYEIQKDGPRYVEYKQQLDAFIKTELSQNEDAYFPVYYFLMKGENQELLMLSPACITREVYRNKISDLLGSHAPCAKGNGLCPGCALFGVLKQKEAVTSRIRITDLWCEGVTQPEKCYDPIVMLPPLSTPRLSSTEFYLKKPAKDAWYWTYDYYIDLKGEIHFTKPQLNGRKFYWHQLNMVLKDDRQTNGENNHDNMKITIRPVKRNIKFKGKLYFEKLTKTELDQLIFLLNAGDENALVEKKHGYKLGAAKPLGLGSVAMSVESVMLKRYDTDEVNHTVCTKQIPYVEYKEPKIDPKILKNFEKMTNFYTLGKGKNVTYPRCEEGGDIFKWFTENHDYFTYREYPRPQYQHKKRMAPEKKMAFKEYMVAMEPELQSTEYVKKVLAINQNGSNGGRADSKGKGKDYRGNGQKGGNQNGKPYKAGKFQK